MPCEHKTKTFKVCRCVCKWRCQCLIPREKKPKPPFNSSTKRDAMIGMHPRYYSGKSDTPAVGTYDLPPIKGKSSTRDWKRELEAEEFSATMGGRVVEKCKKQKELMKTGRGPGTHEIPQWPESFLNQRCKSNKKDVGFGTANLDRVNPISKTPGPGYTRKNPYHYIDKKKKDGSSSVPTFEYDGKRPRFQKTTKSCSLPCNLYNVKHPNSLDAFLSKVTGKRGPYDLFTGPRDRSTIRGHFALSKVEDRGDWPKSLPSALDNLLHKNYFKGRWGTGSRFPKVPGTRMALLDISLCYKDPKHPGPGHYNPQSPRKPRNTKNYPFNINVEFVRPVTMWDIRPGPGRYRFKERNRIQGNGWTFVFTSKAPRTNFIRVPQHNAF